MKLIIDRTLWIGIGDWDLGLGIGICDWDLGLGELYIVNYAL